MCTQQPILYIEDDEDSRQIVKFILSTVMNFKHVEAWSDSSNVLEKIHQLKPRPYLILMDIRMAPHNGYAVMDMLRNNTDFADIKIVALTASFMKEEEKQLKQAGFDSGIAKPIDRDSFPDVITRILHGETVWHISGM
jgi:CheY-like chemotaxis protein